MVIGTDTRKRVTQVQVYLDTVHGQVLVSFGRHVVGGHAEKTRMYSRAGDPPRVVALHNYFAARPTMWRVVSLPHGYLAVRRVPRS